VDPPKANFYHFLFSIGEPRISKLSSDFIVFLYRTAGKFKMTSPMLETQETMTKMATQGSERLAKNGGVPVELFAFDGKQVEAMLFSQSGDLENPKGIVLIGGNCEPFGSSGQTSANYTEIRMCRMQATVLAINFRGLNVGKKTSWVTRTGLYLDVDAAVHFLHCLDIPHSQITIRGRSLGGAAATEVASWRPGVNLINSRSFSRLSTVARFFLHPKTEMLIKIFGWEMDSVAAYRKVTGIRMMETTLKDQIIVPGCRLAEEIDCEEENLILPDYGDSHNRPLLEEDMVQRWKLWDALVKKREEELQSKTK